MWIPLTTLGLILLGLLAFALKRPEPRRGVYWKDGSWVSDYDPTLDYQSPPQDTNLLP